MANTYEAIATVTVGSGGASTIDFTSIPSTYTDLKLVLSGRSTSSGTVASIKFNNSSANFSGIWLVGTGSSALSGTGADYFRINWSASTSNTFGNTEIYIPNYAGSNNKSFSSDGSSENNATEAYANFIAGLWSQTTAINQITLTPNAGNFAQYSTATLYGIKNS